MFNINIDQRNTNKEPDHIPFYTYLIGKNTTEILKFQTIRVKSIRVWLKGRLCIA